MNGLGLATVTHAHTPLEILEGVSYVGDDLASSLDRLRRQVGIKEAAILSTCNRTEVYAVFDGPADPSRLGWFLSQDRHVCWGRIRDHVDLYSDDEVVAHLFKVASGVDSLAFGEAEIVAQIRSVHADLQAAASSELLGLFEAAIRASRTVRSQVDVSHAGASLGVAAVVAARAGAGEWSPRVVLVGAGKIARSVLAALPANANLVVASRTLDGAQRLARGRGRAVPIDQVAPEMAAADTVFFCASSRRPILDRVTAYAVTCSRTSPLKVVDLGLPRNVAAEVRDLEWIDVVDLDGLRGNIDGGERFKTLAEVEPIVAQEVARYREAMIGRSVAPLIADLRTTLASLADSELDRALPHAGPGRDRADRVVRRVVSRVLHGAIAEIRNAAAEGDLEALTKLARAFGSQNSIELPEVVPDRTNKEEVA